MSTGRRLGKKSKRSGRSTKRLRFGNRKRRRGSKLRRYKRRGGYGKLYRKLRKFQSKIAKSAHLEIRRYQEQLNGASIGDLNKWSYRCVDHMGNSRSANDSYVVTARGWNMYNQFAACINSIYGAINAGYNYKFTSRRMVTMFQAPTNTPTFVEVYLLKPKFSNSISGNNKFSPLTYFEMGTSAASGWNPGAEDGYTNTIPGTTDTQSWSVQARGSSFLNYNPLSDRNNFKDCFQIKKKWKFVLGPSSTKVITLKSNRLFNFRPSTYVIDTSSAGYATGTALPTASSLVGGGAVVGDVTPSSRIMIVRWHGFNCISTTNSSQGGQINSGTTADPLMIRRWFEFKLYKEDTSVQVTAMNDSSQFLEGTGTNLRMYMPYNPEAVPVQHI